MKWCVNITQTRDKSCNSLNLQMVSLRLLCLVSRVGSSPWRLEKLILIFFSFLVLLIIHFFNPFPFRDDSFRRLTPNSGFYLWTLVSTVCLSHCFSTRILGNILLLRGPLGTPRYLSVKFEIIFWRRGAYRGFMSTGYHSQVFIYLSKGYSG